MAEKKQRRPGRPFLPEGQGKEEWIHVRLLPGEKEVLEKAAKKQGLRLSEWIRRKLKSDA